MSATAKQPAGLVEAIADRVCAVTGIRRVRREDERRAAFQRETTGPAVAAETLRRIADEIEEGL